MEKVEPAASCLELAARQRFFFDLRVFSFVLWFLDPSLRPRTQVILDLIRECPEASGKVVIWLRAQIRSRQLAHH